MPARGCHTLHYHRVPRRLPATGAPTSPRPAVPSCPIAVISCRPSSERGASRAVAFVAGPADDTGELRLTVVMGSGPAHGDLVEAARRAGLGRFGRSD